MSKDLLKKAKNIIIENTFMSNKKKQYFIDKFINVYPQLHNNTMVYLCISNTNQNKYKKLINSIVNRVNFMRIFFKNNKRLEIWVYPSKFKKILPKKSNDITFDSINSGSTTTYINSSENGVIALWRQEEILKVLVHEIIHSFGIDKKDPEPREAYTELRALLFNIYLTLIEKKKSFYHFDEYLQKEKEFSLNQCYKLKDYCGNNTNANSYYNEKTRLLFNIPKNNWKTYIENNKTSMRLVPKNSLRMTISDLL